jgi:hypothetical protein
MAELCWVCGSIQKFAMFDFYTIRRTVLASDRSRLPVQRNGIGDLSIRGGKGTSDGCASRDSLAEDHDVIEECSDLQWNTGQATQQGCSNFCHS